LDLSKLKLDIYDLLGIILPGLLALAEGWILVRGWNPFLSSISEIRGTALTLLLVFAFGLGHIVQELGDVTIRVLKGKRFLRKSRDDFWAGTESKLVKHAIKAEFGHEISAVDAAYDYCLTKLKGHFEKRDIFVATSDLCRSIIVLSVVALAPAWRMSFHDLGYTRRSAVIFGIAIVVLAVVASLAWRRMIRYRALSEVTVFHAYLGVTKKREADA
jgi:hypothetical protein